MRSFSAMGLAWLSMVTVVGQAGCGDNLQLALVGTGGAGGSGRAGAGGTVASGGRGGTTAAGGRGGTGAAGMAGGSGGNAGGRGSGGAAGEGPGGIGGAGDTGGAAGGAGGTGGVGGGGVLPVISFVTPTAASKLCGAGNTKNGCIADADGTTAGWQGTITVHVTTGNANLAIGGLAFTSKALDASGNASFTGVTLSEGPAVTLAAATDNIPGRGVGTANLTMLVDTIPPTVAPTTLAVVPLDRRAASFTLSWTAPADGTQAVGGYDVHVKTAVGASIDPCSTEVKSVPFSTTPKDEGMVESLSVTGLYVETTYCFTVAATDEVGNVGTALGMVAGGASFNRTILQPSDVAVGDGFGYWIDASSDLIGSDGLSDILVGDYNGHKAYLFAGNEGFNATPTLTFSSTTSRLYFGGTIAAIGDIDADGKQDVAVTSGGDGDGKVYIYKGSSLVAGATLTEAQANYVITYAANYNGSYLGYPVVRVGDFNGDGIDDFALGSGFYGASFAAGRVVIVLGSSTFSSFTLDDTTPATRSRRIVIDSQGPQDQFGISIASTGTHLIVGAPGFGSGKGAVYAFKARAADATGTLTFDTTKGDLVTMGTVANGQVGFGVGVLGGAGTGVIISDPFLTGSVGHGLVDLRIGAGTTGPLSGAVATYVDSKAVVVGDVFGYSAFGGGFSGLASKFSFIGTDLTTPDLVMVPFRENNKASTAYILDGTVLTAATTAVDVFTSASVKVALPNDWFGVTSFSGPARDINGDGYADIIIGELDTATPPSIKGRAIVLW